MIRVGVFGAGGRMGTTVCNAVHDAPDLELVAAVDPQHAGIDLHQLGVYDTQIQIAAKASALQDAGAEVAVDFTVLDAARENLRWCAAEGVHAVVGTTGFTEQEFRELAQLFERSAANAVIAPNFALGAVLMMRFAELASPYFESGEIIELHHDQKADAPSGTAMLTAQRMAGASKDWGDDPTRTVSAEGARGARVGGDPGALGSDARARRPPGGPARHDRPEPLHPPRQLRPLLLHAGRAPGGAQGLRDPRPHGRPGSAAPALDPKPPRLVAETLRQPAAFRPQVNFPSTSSECAVRGRALLHDGRTHLRTLRRDRSRRRPRRTAASWSTWYLFTVTPPSLVRPIVSEHTTGAGVRDARGEDLVAVGTRVALDAYWIEHGAVEATIGRVTGDRDGRRAGGLITAVDRFLRSR